MVTSKCSDSKCPLKGQIKVEPVGDLQTCKYALIGEAPGFDEVRKGSPFVGKTGRLLNAFLKRVGIDREDCYLTNALKCQIPRNLDKLSPEVYEAIACCRPLLEAELAALDKQTRVAMGRIARKAVYPNSDGGILSSRGWWDSNTYVMVHPAYYNYNPDQSPMLLKDLIRVKRGKLPQIGPFKILEYQQKIPSEGYVAYILQDIDDLRDLVARAGELVDPEGFAAFDLETDQIDAFRDRILCMSVSFEQGTAYIIPDNILYEDGNNFVTTNWSDNKFKRFLRDERYKTASYLRPSKEAAELLSELFENKTGWVGHNVKFDWRFLVGQLGTRPPVEKQWDDTLAMHYVLDERKSGHGLKALSDDYYDVGDYESTLHRYVQKRAGRYSRIARDVLYGYNAMDTELTLRLAYDLREELKNLSLWERPYKYPIIFAMPMLLEAELTGMLVDWDEFARVDEDVLGPMLEDLKQDLRRISGDPTLNPLSAQKVIKLVYDELGFPVIEVRTRAAGRRIKKRSTQRAVMDGWFKMRERGQLDVSDEAWEFIEKLREYRHLRKLQGSYIRKWRKYRAPDDRVHTTFQIWGTVTGRLSSKDPPMQTIPSKVEEDEVAQMVADAHTSKPGYTFVYADYSQAELCVAACLTRDDFMIKAYNKPGTDYHSEVATAAFGPDFTGDQRTQAKRLTFGWLFGGNVYEIAINALQYEGSVAKRFAEEWDRIFQRVVEWRGEQAEIMRKQGYVESVFGRRRRYPLITRDNVGKANRVAANSPIQSAASDLTLIAAAKLYREFHGCEWAKVILLIHDSIILEVRDDKVDEVAKRLNEVMVNTAAEVFTEVPFKADVKVGRHLGQLT